MASSPAMPTTVQEVLGALDRVIARAVDEGSRLGYFAAIYRKVTAKVAEGIGSGFFDDAERMQRLDVTFANRYLAALSTYQAGGTPTKSWAMTFSRDQVVPADHPPAPAPRHQRPHQPRPRDRGRRHRARRTRWPSLRRDFDRINEILASMLQRHRPRHRRGLTVDRPARPGWAGATTTSSSGSASRWRGPRPGGSPPSWRRSPTITGPVRSAPVTRTSPDWPTRSCTRVCLSLGLLLIRTRESNDVARVIRVLNSVPGPDLAAVEAAVQQERATESSRSVTRARRAADRRARAVHRAPAARAAHRRRRRRAR